MNRHTILKGLITFLLFSILYYAFFILKINKKIYSSLYNFFPLKLSNEKILLIDSEFELKKINNLLDKLKTAENSIILLLPQIFNIKIGDYLEDIKIDEIKNTKDDYNTFIFKIAEMPNLIPVIFLYNEKGKKNTIDLSKYFYFEELKDKFNLKKYNYIRVISKKLWYSVNDVAFYEELEEYPFEMPLLYNFNNNVLINAALESIRRYYKFPRTQIKYENKNLIAGNIINIPVSSDGKLIIKKYNSCSRIYSAEEILNMDRGKLNDRIIIIKSTNNTIQTMVSLAATIEALINKNFIKYNKILDYFLLVVLVIFLFYAFSEIKLIWGIILTLFLLSVEFFLAIYLIKQNIYFNYALFICAILSVFFSVYLLRMLKEKQIFKSRKNLIIKYVPAEKIKQFINKNIDIKVKNAWVKVKCIYIIFDSEYFADPEKIKITFEKIKKLIYNYIDKYMIKINGFDEIFIVFLEEMDLKREIALLFKIRENFKEINFNIFVNNTEVYFLEYNDELIFIDKRQNVKLQAANIEKRGYILIQGEDIQKYINLIKFQKIASTGENTFFNAVSER